MDQTLEAVETTSFAKDLAKDMGKAAAINAAAVVGVLGGLLVFSEIADRLKRRRAQKETQEQQ